jgi:hypothetical protein
MKRLIPLLTLAALAGCATTTPKPAPTTPRASSDVYRPSDYAWSTAPGTNVILGSVAYQTKAGGTWTCAGSSAALTPATPMSAKRINRLYGSTEHAVATLDEVRSRSAGDEAPPYVDYVRNTRCDAGGKFAFQGLPDGDWFLVARAQPAKGGEPNVVILQYVEVRGGRTVTLALK